jgi:hypothetical protein
MTTLILVSVAYLVIPATLKLALETSAERKAHRYGRHK